MKTICLVLLSLALAYANVFSHDNGVVVLTTSNFDQALQDFDYALVEFYAPWCGHCKRLEPEYAEAAKQLAESNPDIKLCKVDATVEESLAEKFEIGGFPTLKFFRKGGSTIDYNGGRTASEIVNWLRKKTGAPTTEVNSAEDAQSIIKGNSAVALFLGPSEGNNYVEYLAAASHFDDVIFINSNNDEVKSAFGASGDTVIVFASNGEEKNVYSGPITVENVQQFVDAHRFPLVMPFDEHAAQRIFGENLNTVFLVVSDNDKGNAAIEAFKSLAPELKDTVTFSIGKIEEDMGGRLAEYLGIGEDDVPAVRLIEPANDMRKYTLEGEVTASNIKNFIQEFKAGSLKPFYKSEDIPSEPLDGNVRVVVGKNFDEVVLDETKDVFIEFYAPWCGHCQNLAPIYDAFAGKLKGVENLVIAKMDAVANEVPNLSIEGFPTLRFYPRNNKKEPIEFEEDRSEAGLLDFIFRQATVPITGVERPEYTPQSGGDDYEDDHHGHDHHEHDHHGHDHGHDHGHEHGRPQDVDL